jgi:ribosome-binding factor A
MSRPGKHREPSQRQLRVGEELRHALARLFERGTLRDPALTGIAITVTEVRAAPDLKHATAFIMPLGGAHRADVLAGLARSAGYLRHELAKAVPLRHTPELAFELDTSFDYASRIEELLHRPEVERDLQSPHPNPPPRAGEGEEKQKP